MCMYIVCMVYIVYCGSITLWAKRDMPMIRDSETSTLLLLELMTKTSSKYHQHEQDDRFVWTYSDNRILQKEMCYHHCSSLSHISYFHMDLHIFSPSKRLPFFWGTPIFSFTSSLIPSSVIGRHQGCRAQILAIEKYGGSPSGNLYNIAIEHGHRNSFFSYSKIVPFTSYVSLPKDMVGKVPNGAHHTQMFIDF